MPAHKLTTDAARHQSKVDRLTTPDGCWPWTGYVDPDGYGRFKTGSMKDGTRAMSHAHRYALEEALGRRLAPGMMALHTCDVPACCRNDEAGYYEVNDVLRLRRGHLWEGTAADNSADMMLKGRSASGDRNNSRLHPERYPRGAQHPNSKLTDEEVRQIRRSAASQRQIAAEYGVCKATVAEIRRRVIWRHVT